MINLIKKDIWMSYVSKFSSAVMIFLLIPTAAIFLDGDSLDILIFFIPTLCAIYKSIPMDEDNLKKNHNVLIQSLPIKRWEYVISKYISLILNYLIFLVYTILLIIFLSLFGFNHLDYINININVLKETLIVALASFIVLVPISFIFYKWRAFMITFIFMIIAQNYKYIEYGGVINRAIQNLKSGNYFIIIILSYILSIGLSIWFYNNKDLV